MHTVHHAAFELLEIGLELLKKIQIRGVTNNILCHNISQYKSASICIVESNSMYCV